MMQTPPDQAKSNAAKWLEEFGLGSWGDGFTAVTDAYINAGLYSVMALCIIALVGPPLWRQGTKAGRRKQRRDFIGDFDMPALAAVEHMKQTVAHQWDSQDKAERDFWRRIHEQMRAGRLRAIGADAPGGPLRRIKRSKLAKLTPVARSVAPSEIAPYGVRFDLIDEAKLPPLDEQEGPQPGFYDLRIREKELYRLWPQTRVQKGGGA